ncbi:MAG: phosphodiester glycosidase family protein [Smithellaceae bacterium]|nr:phosphodiester glycosidase family protein [Smithellaceae bacterium]
MKIGLLHKVIPILFWTIVSFSPATACKASEQWKQQAPGIEYGLFQIKPWPEMEDGKVHIVRIDPSQVALKLLLASELDKKNRTTAEWSRDFNLQLAINAGMFQKDSSTNVGHLRNGAYIQNRHWNKYRAAFAFSPRKTGLPPAIIIDLDQPEAMERLEGYHAVVQNLRLIKGNGINVWARSDKKWSEAALGIDREGRILFLFCRTPFAMWDFIEGIISLGLGIDHLMHLEGGPLASLSVKTREITLDLQGDFEAIVHPGGINRGQWPIPNVIGVQLK